jgi:hypothetical protein
MKKTIFLTMISASILTISNGETCTHSQKEIVNANHFFNILKDKNIDEALELGDVTLELIEKAKVFCAKDKKSLEQLQNAEKDITASIVKIENQEIEKVILDEDADANATKISNIIDKCRKSSSFLDGMKMCACELGNVK